MPTWDWSKLQPFVNAVKTACNDGALGAGDAVAVLAIKKIQKIGRLTSSAPGTPPASRRGKLRESIQAQQSSKPMTAIIGAGQPYGGVLETGNWGRPITPKKGKYLPVPVNDAAKRWREANGTQSLKTLDTKLIFRGRKMFLLGMAGVRTELNVTDTKGVRRKKVRKDQPLFVLKRSITIKPRPFLVPALKEAKGNDQVWGGFARAVNAGLRKAGFKTKVVRA